MIIFYYGYERMEANYLIIKINLKIAFFPIRQCGRFGFPQQRLDPGLTNLARVPQEINRPLKIFFSILVFLTYQIFNLFNYVFGDNNAVHRFWLLIFFFKFLDCHRIYLLTFGLHPQTEWVVAVADVLFHQSLLQQNGTFKYILFISLYCR